jgi:hypothetical protein
MQQKTLGLIHTSATLVPVFQQLCNQYLPQVKVFNIVDDSLIKNVISCGELTPANARRRFHFGNLFFYWYGGGSCCSIDRCAGIAG